MLFSQRTFWMSWSFSMDFLRGSCTAKGALQMANLLQAITWLSSFFHFLCQSFCLAMFRTCGWDVIRSSFTGVRFEAWIRAKKTFTILWHVIVFQTGVENILLMWGSWQAIYCISQWRTLFLFDFWSYWNFGLLLSIPLPMEVFLMVLPSGLM